MERPLSSITAADVAKIDAWLSGHLAMNTRNTYIAKLTQVLRRAHKEGLISTDAGRDVKTKPVITKSRALTVEQLRTFLALEPGSDLGRIALDFFRLSFYLRAMNPVDLAKARNAQIFNGRLNYVRSKTRKDYSVRIEPEAQAVIDRCSDGTHLLAETSSKDYETHLQHCDAALRALAKGNGLPPVTMYWARHTFATLMIEIGIPIETVAASLGHSYGPKVTMGYVTIREKLVDDAVRKLYDYVAGTWAPEK